MTEHEEHGVKKGKEPLSSPGAGHPTNETLPEESKPAGEAELEKEDVGFGPKGEKDTAS